MALSATEILLLIKAKDEASGVLNNVSKTAQSVGKSMGTALKIGGAVAAAGIGAAAFAAVDFIKKAQQEQVGIERLQTALKTLDAAHRGNAAEVEKVVRARERLAFADDELRDSLSLLVVQTGDYEEAVSRQAIAMDLARGTGMDLQLASKLVGKVTEENVEVLKKYGITIGQGATQTEALAEIQRRFAGQSAAYAETSAAKWKIFNNQLDNIKETIGAALLPVVTQLGAALSDYLLAHEDDVDRFAKLFSEKLLGGIEAVHRALTSPLATHIFDTIGEGFEALQPALQWIMDNEVATTIAIGAIGLALLLAFSPVTGPIALVAAGILGIVYAIGVTQPAVEEFFDKAARAAGDFWDFVSGKDSEAAELANANRTAQDIAYHEMIDGQKEESEGFWSHLKSGNDETLSHIRDGFAFLVNDIKAHWDAAVIISGNAWDAIETVAVAVIGEIQNNWNDLVWLVKGTGEDLKLVGQGIADGFWNVVRAVQAVIDKLQALTDKINSLPSLEDAIPDFNVPSVGDVFNTLTGPFRGATGGIVTRPTLALIGERGPEAVVPLSRAPGASPLGGAAQFTVQIDIANVEGNVDAGMVDRLRRVLMADLESMLNADGFGGMQVNTAPFAS